MKKQAMLFYLWLCMMIFVINSNAQTNPDKLNRVTFGMSRAEVMKLAGKPNKSYLSPINNNKDSIIWDYYNEKTIVYISGKVSEIHDKKEGSLVKPLSRDSVPAKK